MILCDLPYGTTSCHWDVIIPFEPLWAHYERIIKNNGAIVLTASQPFTSMLVMSSLKMFKYCWVWKKERPSNFFAAKFQPLNDTEDIIVFGKGGCNNGAKIPLRYYPQTTETINRVARNINTGGKIGIEHGTALNRNPFYHQTTTGYPHKIIVFGNDKEKTLHPTQKPVSLFEYLIKTYTREGDLVLDNCIGSGTTAIACMNTGRNFIGIEKEEKYVEIARNRIARNMTLPLQTLPT